jgi:hypothetical protein
MHPEAILAPPAALRANRAVPRGCQRQALVQSWRQGLLGFRPGRKGVHGGLTLSIVWVLSLALFVLGQIRFWAKKRPLAISVAAWLLYVALVYLRIVP